MAKQVALIEECDVAYAMSVLGGKWKIVIVWKLLEGTFRFGELKRALPGIAEGVLISQLKELERDGVVERRLLNQVPPHVEYRLGEHARDLQPALQVLDGWGRAHRRRVARSRPR